MALVWLAIVIANERFGILRCDDFPNAAAKWFAYVWLGAFLVVIGSATAYTAAHPPTAQQLSHMSFAGFFLLHLLLVVFLLGWWLATRLPSPRAFLNIPREGNGEAVMAGVPHRLGGGEVALVFELPFARVLKAGRAGRADAP